MAEVSAKSINNPKVDDCKSNDDEIDDTQLQFAAVIGAGNLGSRIALELARNNVCVFLFDPIEKNASVQRKVQKLAHESIALIKQMVPCNEKI